MSIRSRRGSSYRRTRQPPSLRACLYCLKCMNDQLIFGRIIKIVATRCRILRLKWTKFDFDWGSAPDLLECQKLKMVG